MPGTTEPERRCWPIPDPLAEELLPVAPPLVTSADRHASFAAAVPMAGPVERLLGFLGRHP